MSCRSHTPSLVGRGNVPAIAWTVHVPGEGVHPSARAAQLPLCAAARLRRRGGVRLSGCRIRGARRAGASSIRLQQGVDDVHWSMRMALADPAHRELLKPDGDGPKVVEIAINGYVWTAIVYGWQQDCAHPAAP